MGRTRNYELGLYNEFEKLNEKLDKANQVITTLSLNNQILLDEIKELKNIIAEKDKKIELLLEEIERLKNKNNKNSTNSSKPSSTNITTPKKKTGSNQYNSRIKTGKKPGAQMNHQGHHLSKKHIEELIDKNKIEVREFTHIIQGKNSKNETIKYRLGIEIKPYVEKHIFQYDENTKERLPKEFYTDVTYHNSIKSLSIELGAYNVISYDRLSDFFSVITNGIIKISKGTLVNILCEFSNKSNQTLKNLEELLNSKYNYTDETGTKFNGKNMYVRNYSNENTVVYKAHKNKGHKPIIEDNILPRFCGGIIGDHDTTLYSYGTKNYECNVHLGRYLEELIQNIKDILWPIKMKELLLRMNNTKKIATIYGLSKFDNKKIKEYEDEFDNIMTLAKEENKNISSSYYKDKANKLYRRLKKYKKNHLYFIKNFEIPFDNNLSEQDLRILKTKTKISGGFRSMEVAQHYANTLSIIKTSIKRNINPFDSIKAIFDNQVLFVQ